MPRPASFSRARFDVPSPPRPGQRGHGQVDAYDDDDAATTIWNPHARFQQLQATFDSFIPPPPPPVPRSMPSIPAMSMDTTASRSIGFNDPTMTVRKNSHDVLTSLVTTHKWATLGTSAFAAVLAIGIALITVLGSSDDSRRVSASYQGPVVSHEYAPPQVVQTAVSARLPTMILTTPGPIAPLAAPPAPAPAPAPAPGPITASALHSDDAMAKEPASIPTWQASPSHTTTRTSQPSQPSPKAASTPASPRILADVAPVTPAEPTTHATHKDDETTAAQDALRSAKQETEGSLN